MTGMNEERKFAALVIEDEIGDAGLMRVALERTGHDIAVSFVSDGKEALEFLQRQSDRFRQAVQPDLILMDLKMPGKSGLELLQYLKQDERLAAIPVVVVTTSALDADLRAAYRFGAAGYVLKSADFNEFLTAINTLCRYWFELVCLPGRSR